MLFPHFLRNPLAHCLRSLPIKGRWRIAALLQRLFPSEPVTFELANVGRVTLDLGIEMQQHVYWAGLSRDDAAIVRLARALMPRDGVFIDVGANVGLHTLAVAHHVAEGGAVVAFEPHPVNHRLLVHNLEQNRLRHVVAENCGLAEAAATLTGTARADGGNWSLASRGDYRFEVRLIRLDDYWRDHPLPRLDMMKIDVEGAEVRVLRGARQTIERFRPLIVFEVCPSWLTKMQTSAAELFAELVRHGYSIHPLPGRNIAWDRRVKIGDLTGLGAGAFVNLVAVPPSRFEAPPHAEVLAQFDRTPA
ncbi:MAG TPA: FkbM family methyltransferase [Gemmataceae bacterium]|nr:FkbM family methyltransferase [Gemmataceae bacterium]